MKHLTNRWLPVAAALATVVSTACGPNTNNPGGPDAHASESHGEDDGHAHGEEGESAAGATFKPGKGVIVTEETKRILGLEVADVSEERLPAETKFTAQIFGERHHHLPNPADHSGCDVHGSGLVSEEVASNLKKGDCVLIQIPAREPLRGVILAIQKAVALGESEVIVGISNAISVLQAGEFVPAAILHPVEQPTATVPRSALLRTSEGTFVYTVNGDAYFRTPVRTGAESGGRIGIADGLLPGDQVVVKPVQTLWLIELRATKGGGHSH